jgi:hypothetical protein
MTAADLLARLDGAKRTAKGWSARCPSHADRTPSLHIREGARGLLLYCFSGCSVEDVCGALDLTVAELFFDAPDATSLHTRQTEPRRPTIRDLEYRVWARAMALDLRALSVLDAAKGLDVSAWAEADYDAAMQAVTKAYADLRHAERLDRLAFAMRETIQKGEAHAERRRVAH